MRYRTLDQNGDYVFGAGPGEFLVNSPAAVAQAVLTRLKLNQGEWFLDKTVGVPYATQVLGFGTGRSYDVVIQGTILGTPGVNQIRNYSSVLQGRTLLISVTLDTIYGSTAITTSL